MTGEQKRSEIKNRLRESIGGSLDVELYRDVSAAFDSLEKLIESLCILARREGNWRIPLSDGVRAEVTIYGNTSAEHVKAFAAIFQHIADGYVAPVPVTKEGG